MAGHGLGVGTGKQARRPTLAALHGAVRCSGKPAVDCIQQFGTTGDDAGPALGEALAAGLKRPGYVAQAVTRFAANRIAQSRDLLAQTFLAAGRNGDQLWRAVIRV